MKKIRVVFSNGDVYDIPADVIALDRTNYYAEHDKFIRDSPRWNEEYAVSMDDYELIDWCSNNMDWSNVEQHAIKIPVKSHYDYSAEWLNASKSIVKNGN